MAATTGWTFLLKVLLAPIALLLLPITLGTHAARIMLAVPPLPHRRRVAATYVRLVLTHLVVCRLLRRNRQQERFLGYRVRFFDYGEFVSQFRDFFLERWLYFTAGTPRPLIIDCGGHIGMPVLFFKYLYPDAEVWSFEPDDRAFAIMRDNVEANSLSDVHLVRAAICDRDGSTAFYARNDRTSSVGSSIFQAQVGVQGHESRVASVPCQRLSPYVNRSVAFLKMNIEGAEYEVINDIASRLGHVSELLISSHVSSRDDASKLRQMLDLLDRAGFGYTLAGYSASPLWASKGKPYLNYVYAWQGAREAAAPV